MKVAPPVVPLVCVGLADRYPAPDFSYKLPACAPAV